MHLLLLLLSSLLLWHLDSVIGTLTTYDIDKTLLKQAVFFVAPLYYRHVNWTNGFIRGCNNPSHMVKASRRRGTARSRGAALPSKATLCPVWHPLEAAADRTVWWISRWGSSGSSYGFICYLHSWFNKIKKKQMSFEATRLVISLTVTLN